VRNRRPFAGFAGGCGRRRRPSGCGRRPPRATSKSRPWPRQPRQRQQASSKLCPRGRGLWGAGPLASSSASLAVLQRHLTVVPAGCCPSAHSASHGLNLTVPTRAILRPSRATRGDEDWGSPEVVNSIALLTSVPSGPTIERTRTSANLFIRHRLELSQPSERPPAPPRGLRQPSGSGPYRLLRHYTACNIIST
jgi:hypothetical protein